MPVSPSDLIAYASANMPADDSATSGGAIDAQTRVVFTQIADDALTAVSSNAGDTTQTVTVRARSTAGAVVSETKTLVGTTPVSFSTIGSVARVLKVSLSGTCAGTVTIGSAGSGTLATIPVGELGFLCLHREAQAASGSTQTFYYKFFFKNTNGATSLTSPFVSLSDDPSGRVAFALAASINDTGSVTNRKTAPVGPTFATTEATVPATLAAGDRIGVWVRFTHPAADNDYSTNLSMKLRGT